MSEKTKIRDQKLISCCEDKSLAVKTNIVIFLSYLIEKVVYV